MTKEQIALEELRDVYKNAYNIANWDRCRAIETAIEAVEKQIPEKPNKATIKMLSDEVVSSYFICPICDTPLMVGYPCKCGQMIDWSGYDSANLGHIR